MFLETLEKNWKHALLGASLLTGAPAIAQDKLEPAPTEIVDNKPTFDRSTLHPELLPIARLESNMGQYMDHEKHSKGDFHTAYGACGFKPITAFDTYNKSKYVKKLFPNFENQDEFVTEFKNNPQFYNTLAGAHWNQLKRLFGGQVEKAAFAWRWGAGAATTATEEKIAADEYVQKYKTLTAPKLAAKSEGLNKMAIKDLRAGKMVSNHPGFKKVFSYDHLLSPSHIKDGYSMSMNDYGNSFSVHVEHNRTTRRSLRWPETLCSLAIGPFNRKRRFIAGIGPRKAGPPWKGFGPRNVRSDVRTREAQGWS